MSSTYILKSNLLKQTRSYKFMGILMIAVLCAYFCVPPAGSGFEIFHLGGVRGIYNSAWIGALCAVLPTILLWLPGFYLLRSQISEDKRLKIGQVIAASPISKLRYIAGKAISNFIILLALQLLFTASLMVMQLARGESMHLVVLDYLKPLLFITIPYLIFIASLTVLFDVLGVLKGAFGNVLIFGIWSFFTIITVEISDNSFDLFGIGMILSQMTKSAQVIYPSLPSDVGSFGFTVVSQESSTFLWNGIEWNREFLISRFAWIGISFAIIVVASMLFNRFKESTFKRIKPIRIKASQKSVSVRAFDSSKTISPVSKSSSINVLPMLRGELKNMLLGKQYWWYLLILLAIIGTFLFPMGESYQWMSTIMLLLISTFSSMGCREKIHFTSEIIYSSCSRNIHWLSGWIAGIIVSLLASVGIITRLVLSGLWGNVLAWVVGCIFIATLAQTLGSLSGVRKAFEAIFTVLFVLGPIYDMGALDFLGLHSMNITFTVIMTVVLFTIGYGYSIVGQKMKLRSV